MEQIVKANGIDIWCEDFGDPSDPAILSICGASSQGIMCPTELCEMLVAGGRYVIRYDNRDTGKSTLFDFDENPYTLIDMAGDAVGVLGALGIEAAHLVGGSMGGMIAQEVAINYPERVLTLTSWMSTPGAPRADDAGSWTNGPPTSATVSAARADTAPPTTREERIQASVDLFRRLSGSALPFDEPFIRGLAEQVEERAVDLTKAANHGRALAASRDRTELLADVTVPALVIHGTEDPIIPYEHGVLTAKAIPGAKLLPLEGIGHEFPPGIFRQMADAILEHSA